MTMPLSGQQPTKKIHTGTAHVQKVHNDPSVPTHLNSQAPTIGLLNLTTTYRIKLRTLPNQQYACIYICTLRANRRSVYHSFRHSSLPLLLRFPPTPSRLQRLPPKSLHSRTTLRSLPLLPYLPERSHCRVLHQPRILAHLLLQCRASLPPLRQTRSS
jgi:hypothetical protein